MTPAQGPPARVLAAFGVAGRAVRLRGGQGTSWRVGPVVLKPGVDPAFQEWLGTELADLPQRGFRLPRVWRALDGAWVVDGWAAQSAVAGSTTRDGVADWHRVIAAARDLHAATAALARPAILDLRTDAWARADRAAWGEDRRDTLPELRELVGRLEAGLAPLGPAQVVHGDLSTNVLLAPGEPPSVIDFSPYWRPPLYAEGIVLADALCWHGAPVSLLEELGVTLSAVARGLLFRVLTAGRLHRPGSAELTVEAQQYRRVVDALGL